MRANAVQAFLSHRKADFRKVSVVIGEDGIRSFEEFIDRYGRPMVSHVIADTAKQGRVIIYRIDETADPYPKYLIVRDNRLELPPDADKYHVLERADGATFHIDYQIVYDNPHGTISPEKEDLLVRSVVAEYLEGPVAHAHDGGFIGASRKGRPN